MDAEVDAGLTGAELARMFYADVVRPLLGRHAPGLRHAAGRLGTGSDVLGLDDATSRDHDWGCRLTLLVDDEDRSQVPLVKEMLEASLPERFAGAPVRFPVSWDPSPAHRVEVDTVGGYVTGRLGVDASHGLSVLDWLCLTGQSVLEVTAGPVFTDQTRALGPVRAQLAWYPRDVERYVLAGAWQRLWQLMPFVGRTALVGDELGSRLLSARLADDLVTLAFLLSRAWAPYAKWRGSAFRALPAAREAGPLLDAAAGAPSWQQREAALAGACEALLRLQRERGLPAPERAVIPFWDRPFRTVDAAVPALLLESVTDPEVKRLPPLVGSVEQWADSTDVLAHGSRRAALRSAYESWGNP